MYARFKEFLADDGGAITVDWVVITAACVALALLATVVAFDAVRDRSIASSVILEAYEINDEFDTQAEINSLQ